MLHICGHSQELYRHQKCDYCVISETVFQSSQYTLTQDYAQTKMALPRAGSKGVLGRAVLPRFYFASPRFLKVHPLVHKLA